MKRILMSLSLLLTASAAFAGFGESQYLEARLGALMPWNIQPGFLGEITYGIRVDQMVSVNLGMDYYTTSYQTAATNAAPSTGLQTQGLQSDLSANLLMLLLNVRIDAPFNFSEVFQPYAQVGVGYELMINNYLSQTTNTTYVFGGFGLKLSIGTKIKLGDRTALIVDVGYNFSTLRRSNTSTTGVIVGELIDIGGFGVSAGVSFQL